MKIPTESTTENLRPIIPDTNPDFNLHEPYAIVKNPTPFLPAQHLTTVKPAFHFITKAPKSTHQISSSTVTNKNTTITRTDADVQSSIRLKIIVPTTYSPPKYLLKSILPQNPIFSFRPKNQSRFHKTLKAVRKLINPITVNHELSTSTGATYESAEDIVDQVDFEKPDDLSYYLGDKNDEIQFLGVHISSNHTKPFITSSTSTTSIPIPTTTEQTTTKTTARRNSDADHLKNRLYALLSNEKLRQYVENDNKSTSSEKRFRTTVEIPRPQDILDDDKQKPEPDQPPSYKPKPILVPTIDIKTDSPVNTSYPTRVSRVNAAIKSLIAIAGTKGPSKCSEKGPNCKVEAKQRYLSSLLFMQINLHGTAPIFLTFCTFS